MLYTLGQYIVNVQSSTTSNRFSTIFTFGICGDKRIGFVVPDDVVVTLGFHKLDENGSDANIDISPLLHKTKKSSNKILYPQ